jgi:predicted nucleic acid-binding protein
MKVLIDTNVILDFFLTRTPHDIAAKKIFEMTYQEKITAFITASSVTDIYYIVKKRLGDSKARDVLINLLNLLIIIAVDGIDCVSALGLPIIDFEDAVVVACAKKCDIDVIITNDVEFQGIEPTLIRVISPNDFLNYNKVK